ncbi:hypothetical protein JQ625_30765 [Bradyrhizobium diazoefficiens]|nr:hypothetical protein [Bradyrhizobium diazoefficiens]MBR0779221.1 hypothetical protein [Bradyrhizobium diazoefficiens]
MAKWIASVVAFGLVAGLPDASAARVAVKPEASAGRAVFDARRGARHDDLVPYATRRDPHYFARPVTYRPYPYGVPAPFVFGFGPWWR